MEKANNRVNAALSLAIAKKAIATKNWTKVSINYLTNFRPNACWKNRWDWTKPTMLRIYSTIWMVVRQLEKRKSWSKRWVPNQLPSKGRKNRNILKSRSIFAVKFSRNTITIKSWASLQRQVKTSWERLINKFLSKCTQIKIWRQWPIKRKWKFKLLILVWKNLRNE